jgi:hypothetical protein
MSSWSALICFSITTRVALVTIVAADIPVKIGTTTPFEFEAFSWRRLVSWPSLYTYTQWNHNQA